MNKFTNQLVAIIAVCAITLAVLYWIEAIDGKVAASYVISFAMNFTNSLAAYFLFEKSLNKSGQEFLIYNLGGMTARILILLVVIFLVIKFAEISLKGFLISFFVLYFILLILEILHYKIRISSRKA